MNEYNEESSHKPDHARQLEILDRISSTVVADLRLDTIVQEVTDCATEMTGQSSARFFTTS
jgi:hypothetical protein